MSGSDRTQAEVVSAVPLAEPTYVRIQAELERLAGRALDLHRRVDPGILGGLVVRVGDRRLDLSLAARLASLRERMSARPE